MTTPLEKLAFSVEANPRRYVLLLGAGVSRPAGVPTGGEVTNHLIRRLADVRGETPDLSPEEWYEETFDNEATYQNVIGDLTESSADRQGLLRRYFEPDDQEEEQGLKTPQEAHYAISRLVDEGYVPIIVTTNFDRLIEQALQEQNVSYTVASTGDQVENVLPPGPDRCVVLKVNGDYLHENIRNTEDELESYDDRMEQVLHRVFSEYGLVVAGWSGEADTALRRILRESASGRFSTFWTARSEPGEPAQEVIRERGAVEVGVEDTNQFFPAMADLVEAAAQSQRTNPVSRNVAVERAKRYLTQGDKTRLHDLVMAEVERVRGVVYSEEFPVHDVEIDEDEIQRRIEAFEGATGKLASLAAIIGYWGDREDVRILVDGIEWLAERPQESTRNELLHNFRLYPALIVSYATGLTGLARDDYVPLGQALLGWTHEDHGTTFPAAEVMSIPMIADRSYQFWPEEGDSTLTVSRRLEQVLRQPTEDVLPNENKYRVAFEKYEYVASLLFADAHERSMGGFYAPRCLCHIRWRRQDDQKPEVIVGEEIESQGEEWPLLQMGAFEGSLDRLNEVKQAVDGAFSNPLGLG